MVVDSPAYSSSTNRCADIYVGRENEVFGESEEDRNWRCFQDPYSFTKCGGELNFSKIPSDAEVTITSISDQDSEFLHEFRGLLDVLNSLDQV